MKSWIMPLLMWLLVITVALLIACTQGCVTMTVTAPDGATFTRTAFGINPQIGTLIVEKKSESSYKLTVRGLDSNSTDAVGVAVAAAIGAMKAAP